VSLPTQATNLASQCVPEGDATVVDVSDDRFSSRDRAMDEIFKVMATASRAWGGLISSVMDDEDECYRPNAITQKLLVPPKTGTLDPGNIALVLRSSHKPVEDDKNCLLRSAARLPRAAGISP
jgi:hypothetical protein